MLKIVLIILVVGGALVAVYARTFIPFIQEAARFSRNQLTQELAIDVSRLEEAAREIVAPPPLRRMVRAPTALTVQGTLTWTNVFRAQMGFSALAENALLRRAAEIKLADMFKNQYFEHISPLGVDVSDLAGSVGYAYVIVGENLALGDYENDQTLVQAWMDSPGHRANILHDRYSEIGIAVGKGMFEGTETWLAVQEFGVPLSACPSPSEALRQNIEGLEESLEAMSATIDAKRKELEAWPDKRSSEFNNAVEAYNALVHQYNELIQTAKSFIDSYNVQIKQFNSCIVG